MKKIRERVATIVLAICMVLAMMPANTDAAVIGDVNEGIKYQVRNDSDVRLVAYVDDYKAYSSVSFTLTIDGNESEELVCTTAYSGIYAAGELYTTQKIYGVDGYFVTYVINGYMAEYSQKEVTITATYTAITGEVHTEVRTVTIGDVEESPKGNLTFANGWDWSDTFCYQKQIFVFTSADATATPASMHGQSVGFLRYQNGIILEYNETNGTWKVVTVDFVTTDGINPAEAATLGNNRMAIIFHDEAVMGQEESFNFFKSYAVVDAEFYLSVDFAALQSVSGKISNVTLSFKPIEEDTTEPEQPINPEDITVGTVQSTVGKLTSRGQSTASSGDTDGLSCVLYAPQNNTVGISTYVNLAAAQTTLYTNSEALAKQNMGSGIANDKDVDNAYMYLCVNSTNWSGDFGLIKRLGDKDWEIVTSESYYGDWRWNAYSWSKDVTVSYDSDYVYSKWNVMDGVEALYIKDSNKVKDLQMNLMYSDGKLTYSICIGNKTIFSVYDTGTISNGKYGRAISLTNSNAATYDASNYLNYISSSKMGRTPAELTNVQCYDTYYYTSKAGAKKLTIASGSLWIYPNLKSHAGYLVNKEGNPIVTCEEVVLTNGSTMDIINIQNY